MAQHRQLADVLTGTARRYGHVAGEVYFTGHNQDHVVFPVAAAEDGLAHLIEEKDGGVLMKDLVHYALPLWPFGEIGHGIFP